MAARVQVQGLRELRRALRQIDPAEDLKELREGLKRAAGIVATDASRRARMFSSRAAATIRATAGGNRAYVVGGKAKLPWYGWADFGTRTPRSGQPRSQGPWKHSGKGPSRGRFIFPALDDKEPEVVRAVEGALDVATRRVNLR